jgi:hypothetical protein
MRKTPLDERAIGELITESQDLQSDAMRTAREVRPALVELHHDPREHSQERRTVLRNGGLGIGALAARGLVGTALGSAVIGAVARPAAAQETSDDLSVQIFQTASSLENLAVQTYQAALDAAAANKLGDVPPAVAAFAKTAMAQHADHAGAWNSVLTGAGKPAVTGVDITVNDAVVKPGFSKVKNVGDLAKFALALEDVAAATYLNGIQNALTLTAAIKIAASIQPVEMQHSAILNLLLGKYPVPDSFAKVDGARPPSDKIG